MICHTWRINIRNFTTIFGFLVRCSPIEIKLFPGILIFKNVKNVPWVEATNVQYHDFNLTVQSQVVIPSETVLTDEGEDEDEDEDGKSAEAILRIVFANSRLLVSEPGCL